jgi:hypothetical protein
LGRWPIRAPRACRLNTELELGAHRLTATYAGSGTLATSTSTALSENVQFAVKPRFTPPLSAKAGTTAAVKLTLAAYVGGKLTDGSVGRTV